LRKAKLGPEHLTTLFSMQKLAEAYLAAGRHNDAEPLLRTSLASREKIQPDDWNTFLTMSLLGGVLHKQSKNAEAEPLLLKGYAGLKERQAKIPAASQGTLVDAIERIVAFYETTGQLENMAKWRSELEEAKKKQKESKKQKPAEQGSEP
jgi:hypothetical protein